MLLFFEKLSMVQVWFFISTFGETNNENRQRSKLSFLYIGNTLKILYGENLILWFFGETIIEHRLWQ